MGYLDQLKGKAQAQGQINLNPQANAGTPWPNRTPTQGTPDPMDRIANSEARDGGIYPMEGVYPLLYVDSLKMIKNRRGEDVFVAEFDILESDVEERPAGTRMSWVVNFRHDASPGAVKGFLASLMGADAGQIDKATAALAISDQNPCRGRLIRLEASTVKTKANKDFTLCKWRQLSEEIQTQADQIRLQAGFPPF